MTLKVYCTCIGHLTSNYCFWIKADCVNILDHLKPRMMTMLIPNPIRMLIALIDIHVLATLNC